ncbi:MAG: PfkB family carbohydrate kinase [Cytophagales bacterium]|nr:PfkB family carbohydrate kinase [Cytophagales bacterium]
MKITALTSCCADFFPEQDQIYVGGNSLNFATQCKQSGIEDVSVIGGIGHDEFGRLISDHLKKAEINHRHLYTIAEPTASNKIYVNEAGDRYFNADSWQGGAFDAFRLSENDWKLVEESDLIAMPGGDPNLEALLHRRHDDQLVVIDFLDYLALDFIEQHIANIDIVFLSGKEESLVKLQALSSQYGKMIVTTLGAKGSIAFYDGKTYNQQAIEVAEVVDTTGCGDAFQAAFSINWLQLKDISKAMQAGAEAASKVLSFMGGVA